jgi:hypothetical protein
MGYTGAETRWARLPWTDREWGGRHQLFRELPDELRRRLPPDLRDFTFRLHGSLAQLHYDDARIHYEVWFHWRTGRVEIGLHLERDEQTNLRYFAALDREIVRLKVELGDGLALEGWDKGWARLYETWPCDKVDPAFREDLIDRLARLIATVQPICAATAVRR